jgi:hypothetical protein
VSAQTEVRGLDNGYQSRRPVYPNLARGAEHSGFDVMVTPDQNIRYQKNLNGRKPVVTFLES